MIFVTSDTHQDFSRFSNSKFPPHDMNLTKDDTVIICGDFGGIWSTKPDGPEKWWMDWLESKPYTIAFVDGNHENFDRLNNMPIETWNGGQVHFIRPHVIHLMRGECYTIENHKFFCFGGASSHDIADGILEAKDPRIADWYLKGKMFRINHISWWENEMPTSEEMHHGALTLEKTMPDGVDFIITHSPPSSLLKMVNPYFQPDRVNVFLQSIKNTCPHKHWYFGHLHCDMDIPGENATCLYYDIRRIV